MKKWMGWILCLALVLACAFAQADSVKYDQEKRTLTVTCTHLTPGEAYSFIATKGTNVKKLDSKQIIYLNQFHADEKGKLRVLIVGGSFSGAQTVRFYMGGKLKGKTAPHLIGKYQNITSSLTLPAGLTEIAKEAFAGDTFQAVYLGSQVKSIGSKAFRNCKALVYIQIPASVETIAEDAFSGCGQLTIGCVRNSAAYRFAQEHGFEIDELPTENEKGE